MTESLTELFFSEQFGCMIREAIQTVHFNANMYARPHDEEKKLRYVYKVKTVLKSSLKNIYQGDVIGGNYFNFGSHCYSGVKIPRSGSSLC